MAQGGGTDGVPGREDISEEVSPSACPVRKTAPGVGVEVGAGHEWWVDRRMDRRTDGWMQKGKKEKQEGGREGRIT